MWNDPANTPSDASAASAEQGFWDDAAAKKAATQGPAPTVAGTPGGGGKKPRRALKIVLGAAGGVLLLLAIAVILAPNIAGSVAPGMIEGAAKDKISGKVTVSNASFSWGGPQVIGPITISDATTGEVARVKVETSAGLMGLVSGAMGKNIDVGTVKISGAANVIKAADGKTNLQRALAPKAAPGATKPEPAKAGSGGVKASDLPEVKGKVLISGVDVVYTDETPGAKAVYAIKDLASDSAIDLKGRSADARLTLTGKTGAGDKAANALPGVISVDATVSIPVNATGFFTPEGADVNAVIKAEGVPLQMVDGLANQNGKLVNGLGDSASVALTIKGTLQKADLSLAASAPRASADAALKIENGVLSASRPIEFKAQGAAINALVPAIDQGLKGQDVVSLSALPDVQVLINTLRVKLPQDFAKAAEQLDLRGGAADVTVRTTAMNGGVKLRTEPNAKPSSLAVQPLELRINAQDLGGPIRITATTGAAIDGQGAGALDVDLSASNLLDKTGKPNPAAAALEGKANLRNVATAIAQPFVSALKLDLPADIGPRLDLELIASAKAPDANAAPGALPKTDLDIGIGAEQVTAHASLQLADGVLSTRNQGIQATVKTAGRMASRFVDESTGFAVEPAGAVSLNVQGLSFPLPQGGAAPNIGAAAATAVVDVSGLTLRPTRSASNEPIQVRSIKLSTTLAPKTTPKINIDSAMNYRNSPFAVVAALELPGLLTGDAAKPINAGAVRPSGKIELRDVPTALAAALPNPPPETPAAGAKPAAALDLAALLKDAVGPTVSVAITSAPVQGAADALAFGLDVKSQRIVAAGQATVEPKSIDFKGLTATAQVTPETVQTLLAGGAEGGPPPQLAAPAQAKLTIDPVQIPLTKPVFEGLAIDVSTVGDAMLRVQLPQQTLVRGIKIPGSEGAPARDLGEVGLDNLDLSAKLPLAALDASGATWSKRAEAKFTCGLLTGPQERAGDIRVNAVADLGSTAAAPGQKASGNSLRALKADVTIDKVRLRTAERLAQLDDELLTGALGDTASVTVGVDLKAPAGGELKDAAMVADASLTSPRMKLAEPMRVAMGPDRIKLERPARLDWEIDPQWANRFLQKSDGGQSGGQSGSGGTSGGRQEGAQRDPVRDALGKALGRENAGSGAGGQAQPTSARFASPTKVAVAIERFAIGKGEQNGQKIGPLKPGIFEAAATIDVPTVELAMSDGSRVAMNNTRVNVSGQPTRQGEADAVAFKLSIDRATVTQTAGGGQPATAERMALEGNIRKLADGNGNVTPDTAVINASGDLPVLPTAVIDTLANQQGLLVDALGPVTSVKVRADNFSKNGGAVDLEAKSNRASASVRGGIKDQLFVADAPVRLTVTEVSPQLTQRLLKGVPIVGSIQKTPQDQPATVVATGLQAPLDNNMARLQGKVDVDPGEMAFEAGGAFAKLLNAAHQKTAGKAGRRLEPLKVDIVNGIATYERWSLPLGEFQVQTAGTVDLVARKIDVLTYLPLGALSDETAKLFKQSGGLGKILGGDDGLTATTMLPFRTKGTFDDNRTEPDLELFAKEFIKNVKPEDLIKKGLGDLLKKQAPGGGK